MHTSDENKHHLGIQAHTIKGKLKKVRLLGDIRKVPDRDGERRRRHMDKTQRGCDEIHLQTGVAGEGG